MQLTPITTLATLSGIAFGLPGREHHSGHGGGSRDKCYNAVRQLLSCVNPNPVIKSYQVFKGPEGHKMDDCNAFFETIIEPCPV